MQQIEVDIQKELFSSNKSKIQKYCALFIGKPGWVPLLKYELIHMLCGQMSGAAGLFLRSKLYPRLLGSCGRNVTFGRGTVLRHPHKIHIGDDVVIDDGCLLDAKGTDNRGIHIGQRVFIGRNTILSCKNGDIHLGNQVNIGFNCEIFSGSRVTLADNVLVAAYTYFIGGGHEHEQTSLSVLEQPRESRGITVGEGCWFGAGVKIMDGTDIGRQTIIGTGAVVTQDIPDYKIAVGIPAKIIKDRKADSGAETS